MALRESLIDIARLLREGRFPNEQAVSQGIVLRILSDLGWNTWDPETVWPEYGVGGRFVDFSLCFPAKRPKVFIEVKQTGKSEGADKQLFDYAYHEGVPMAVLTDGKSWSFYLPGEQGSFEERRVYKLDLLERSPDECCQKLVRYLECVRVTKDLALEDARKDYQDKSRRKLAWELIPKVWKELIESDDPSVFDRLSKEVENKCGVKPDVDDIREFLMRMQYSIEGMASSRSELPRVPETTSHSVTEKPESTLQDAKPSFAIRGKATACRNAKEVMIGIFRSLSEENVSFTEKCFTHTDNQGWSRTYVARNTSDLYPNRPDLEVYSEEFTSGWFIATNLSNALKKKLIAMAADVAGLRIGTELKYNF